MEQNDADIYDDDWDDEIADVEDPSEDLDSTGDPDAQEDEYDDAFYDTDADPDGYVNALNDFAANRSNVTLDSLMSFGDDTSARDPLGLSEISQMIYGSAQYPADVPHIDASHTGEATECVSHGAASSNDADPDAMMTTDPLLLENDMIAVLDAELANKRIDGHQIDSMNCFYLQGVKQIITEVFKIEKTVNYKRTTDNTGFVQVSYEVKMSNVELAKPTTNDSFGRVIALTPNMAHQQGIPYNLSIYVDVNITLTATRADGTTETRHDKLKHHKIASIPCCVGSIMCATGDLTREANMMIHEDPHAPKGYFILKNGNMWNMEMGENLVNNTLHVYKHRHKDEVARGTFLSKPGDAFENSYQIILKLLDNGAILIEMTTNKNEKLEIPFYIMFRALGMTVDYDIVDHIVHGADNTDSTSIMLKKLLDIAFNVKSAEFEEVDDVRDSVTVLLFIANKFKVAADKNAAKKNINVQKYMINSFVTLIDKMFFPHIGTLASDRGRKLRFLAQLIRELLSTYTGIQESTDRDSCKNKRYYPAGIAFAKAFKTKYNLSVVLSLHRDIGRAINNTPFDKIRLAEVVHNAISKADLDKAMVKAMAPSKKGAGAKITARITTNQLYHKNEMNIIAAINAVTAPNPPVGKSNDRAREMRQPHPTQHRYVCISASPDTGEDVGMHKMLAVSASVAGSIGSEKLKKTLREDPAVILDVPPSDIQKRKLALVLVNGDPIGYCEKSHEFAMRYRNLRRKGEVVHRRTTIVWELHERKVLFWTDYGRLHCPLVIVYNNLEEYERAAQAGKPIPFKQWVRLTAAHIHGLVNNTLSIRDLEEQGVLEYISPEESLNTYIANSLSTLRKHQNDECHPFTHCDIPQSVLGIAALANPVTGHSNAIRGTMQYNHRKQSCGWYALNFPFIIEKNTSFQHYVENPLVGTFADRITTPTGHNVIVALECRTGYNAEDSIHVNASTADRGCWTVSQYNFEKAELDRGEHFGMPDITATAGIKREASYAKLDGIAAKIGSVLNQNDVVIAKVLKLPKPDINGKRYKDESIMYRRDEPSRVVNVIRAHNGQNEFIRVHTQSCRPLGDGDKLASRTGNKGIVSITSPACDMPYTADGLTVDLLVNSHTIPTRMILNQIIECQLGPLASKIGSHVDATAFRSINIRGVRDKLAEFGLEYSGHRRLYSGLTGEPIDSLIFIGATNYQRLEKFVVDEQYAINTGPTSALTHQPVQGKQVQGSLRLGEMEKDTMCAQGSMQLLHDKMWRSSDGAQNIICKTCGIAAVYNEQLPVCICRNCGNRAEFRRITTTWSANLLHQQLNAMGVSPEFQLS